MNPDRRFVPLLAFGILAAALLARWGEAWSNFPDLAHAWLVPVLAAYLAWERRHDQPAASAPPRPRLLVAAGVALAAGYVAGRTLLAPFPAWPAALWLFSLAGWGLALALFVASAGPARAKHHAFPLLFTATALPWFTWIDVQLILPLRAGLAAVAAELIHALGYPASADGAVITVGRGLVGVDEACGGVRSLQTGILVALFCGELLRLGTARRLALLALAIGLALLSNLGRTCFLAWQAAVRGPEAVERWHDTAGLVQLVVALGGLALIAWRWSRFSPALPVRPAPQSPGRPVPAVRPALALMGLVATAELGVALWFHPDLARPATATDWHAALPLTDPTYEATPFGENVRALLRCDDYQAGRWQTPSGARRAAYVLDWRRGEVARDVIALHNPEVCLPGGGSRLLQRHAPVRLPETGGPALPFELSTFEGRNGRFHVFYLAWDRTHARVLAPARDIGWRGWWAHRLAEVAARRARFEACVVALAIYDEPDLAAARTAFLREAAALLGSSHASKSPISSPSH